MLGSFGIICCIIVWFRVFCRWGNKVVSDIDELDMFDNEEVIDGVCSWRVYDYIYGYDCVVLIRNLIS